MKWILVRDELPQIKQGLYAKNFYYSKDVMVTDGYNYRTGYYAENTANGTSGWLLYDDDAPFSSENVIAWMPILKFEMGET